MRAEALSDRMLRENAEVFQAMTQHRFVQDIRRGKLSRQVFERYLVYECAFVDTAISIFAYAAATAPAMAQKRWLINVLDALANQQMVYFDKAFASRGIDPSAYDVDLPAVAVFRSGMLEIAREGGFLDTVVAMFVAEWMYWSWSKETAKLPINDPLLRDWVGLHAQQEFADQAMWLKQQVDMAGAALGATEQSRLSAIFHRAMRLEIDFHDAPYL